MREKKNINIQIGANIQVARERANYTQERLSELVGITPNHLSAIERGASGASLELIQKLCPLLHISADFIIFGTNDLDDFSSEIARQLGQVKSEYRPQVNKVLAALLDMLRTREDF